MNIKKDLKGMDVKEMIRCEGCGEYHSMEECEVVIIKIIKGKNCQLKPQGQTVVREIVRERAQATNAVVDPANIDDRAIPPPQDVPVQTAKPRRQVVPPQILSMMVPTDHPNFEQFGAKETRHAR